jgi:hypothetical protein
MTRYAVVAAQGYFGDKTTITSTHRTLDLALRARGAGYVDECGRRRQPLAILRLEGDHILWFRRGAEVWSDMYPTDLVVD